MKWLGTLADKCVDALTISISMYSSIPVPHVKWSKDNMRYSLCFFPFVGMIICGAMQAWLFLAWRYDVGPLLKGAVGASIPLLISGGIHMDGFMDTIDALASHQDREKKLAILKDTHTGAFAVMGCAVYLLLLAGGISEANMSVLPAAFVFSRALSGLSLVTMKSASKGTLEAFSSTAERRAVCISMAMYILAFGGVALAVNPLPTLVGMGLMGLCYLYYWRMAIKHFGGITGDLAGWFTQTAELLFVLGFVVSGRVL